MDPQETVAELVPGLAAFADGFLVDQWGVRHDGAQLHPGVVAALAPLRARGKQVVVLSNSGRRAEANGTLLNDLGIPRDSCDQVVTSGEWVWHAFAEWRDALFAGLGQAPGAVGLDFVKGVSTDGAAVSRAR